MTETDVCKYTSALVSQLRTRMCSLSGSASSKRRGLPMDRFVRRPLQYHKCCWHSHRTVAAASWRPCPTMAVRSPGMRTSACTIAVLPIVRVTTCSQPLVIVGVLCREQAHIFRMGPHAISPGSRCCPGGNSCVYFDCNFASGEVRPREDVLLVADTV